MKIRHLASSMKFTTPAALGALAILATLLLPVARAEGQAQAQAQPGQAQAKPASTSEIVASVNNAVITLAEYQKAEQQLRDEVTRTYRLTIFSFCQ